MRDFILYLVLIINLVSLVAMVAGILMHSGRGGGLSDMFGGGSATAMGSSAAERNLNRITTVFALVWIFTVVALVSCWSVVDAGVSSKVQKAITRRSGEIGRRASLRGW